MWVRDSESPSTHTRNTVIPMRSAGIASHNCNSAFAVKIGLAGVERLLWYQCSHRWHRTVSCGISLERLSDVRLQLIHVDSPSASPRIHCTFTWEGSWTAVSGVRWYRISLPVTQMCLPPYVAPGSPNFGRSLPQITTVKIWFGYGLSRLMKVGLPRLRVVCACHFAAYGCILSEDTSGYWRG